MIRYIHNEEHFSEVLALASKARHLLWLGTADLKDLQIKRGSKVEPFLGLLAERLERGVEVRLLHAKEPGPNFREDFDRYPILATQLKRRLCPRVHFKLFIVDDEVAYIGSANLTGAAMGMKSPKRRNFEAGILARDPALILAAQQHFMQVWQGDCCAQCGRKRFCTDPF